MQYDKNLVEQELYRRIEQRKMELEQEQLEALKSMSLEDLIKLGESLGLDTEIS